ncbi:pyridoxamine 5'-phosphate oxidase family protein [Prevotella sp. tc2-28]|uniref:pyridoxamine 5'-phosphate oxidase family protein n=1 Tax=Prevotella sp. tc2-28 TaxID=1761888 RepID=UPI000B8A21CA|nr:pyridoxamine 5'-phosphate oxidase family protein [Prevotella sp. tc2-28]
MVSEMFDKAFQFLKDHKEVAFATSEGDCPKLRIFQIMKQEGHVLYFATSAKKAVYRELRQNPNVEILAYADNISVRCSGMVNFNVEDDVKRWIYDNNPVLSRLYTSYDQMEYFCLPIAEMDYYDLSPTPPMFQHFDLIAGEVCDSARELPNMFEQSRA